MKLLSILLAALPLAVLAEETTTQTMTRTVVAVSTVSVTGTPKSSSASSTVKQAASSTDPSVAKVTTNAAVPQHAVSAFGFAAAVGAMALVV